MHISYPSANKNTPNVRTWPESTLVSSPECVAYSCQSSPFLSPFFIPMCCMLWGNRTEKYIWRWRALRNHASLYLLQSPWQEQNKRKLCFKATTIKEVVSLSGRQISETILLGVRRCHVPAPHGDAWLPVGLALCRHTNSRDPEPTMLSLGIGLLSFSFNWLPDIRCEISGAFQAT